MAGAPRRSGCATRAQPFAKGHAMRISILSSLLLSTALAVTPSALAGAAPAPAATVAPALPTVAPTQDPDAVRYAAREAQEPAPAAFHGGSDVLVIGGSSLTIALLIILVVILL
jgi:hypothetical protein